MLSLHSAAPTAPPAVAVPATAAQTSFVTQTASTVVPDVSASGESSQQPNSEQPAATETKPVMNLFSGGFSKFYEMELFPDVILHHENTNKEFKCHKAILTFRCPYFKNELQDEQISKLTLKYDDPENVLEKVIKFLYSGKTEITEENLVAIKIAASFFQIDPLHAEVEGFLKTNVTSENVFQILYSSLKAGITSISQCCVEYIASNFEQTAIAEKFKSETEKLPKEVFFQVIGHEKMREEISDVRGKLVTEIVHDYMKKHSVMENKEHLMLVIDAMVSSNTLNVDDATMFLAQCDKLNLAKQAEGCANVLATNFHYLNDKKFINQLRPSSFCSLLRSDHLFIKSEDNVLETAMEYVAANEKTLSEEDKKQIYESVRLTFLSFERLKSLVDNPPEFISIDDLTEALWARVGRLEQDEEITTKIETSETYTNLRPRRNRVFLYSSDFDKNGILYWLGTNRGTEKYINPHLRGHLTVTATANPEVGKVYDLISFDPTRCNLVSKVGTKVLIKFHQVAVLPTKYTLRHTLSRDTECLRNWRFQGSKDGVNFVDLMIHANDSALNTKGATFTWSLDPAKVNDYYQYLQILQDGNNSSNNTYFSLAGVEVYGLVKKLPKNVMIEVKPNPA